MTKQINLLHPGMLPGFGPVQLPVFISAILFALIAGIGWFSYAWYERQTLLAEEASWLERLTADVAALEAFQAQHPNLTNETELEARYQQLQEQLEFIREAYSGIAAQVETKVDGFYGSLNQLTQYDVDGLWLDEIHLKDGTNSFSLQGYARDPELIPVYLQQLGQSSFAGISIRQLSVNREQDQSLWRFRLSNSQSPIQGGN